MALSPRHSGGPLSQINVTPLADVIIVLLIVMMVAVPLLDRVAGLELPGAAHAREAARDAGLTLIVRADASLWLGQQALPSRAALETELRPRLLERALGQRLVWLEADQDLPYADIDRLMQACRAAGAEQVALVAAPAEAFAPSLAWPPTVAKGEGG